MNRNIIFIIHCSVGLFLAFQVWVWFRFYGVFWVSDSLGLMESLFRSVSPLKISLDGFVVFIVPALVVSFITQDRLSPKSFVLTSVLLGILFSILYLFIIVSSDFAFIKHQLWVYGVAGALSGLTFGMIQIFPWGKSTSSPNFLVDPHSRRKLLGSVGLLAGTTGLLGSLTGPLHFLKNQNKFVDVDLELLIEGQMMVAQVADKPVFIIKRSKDTINLLRQENVKLDDPHSKYSQQPKLAENSLRSIRPEYLIAVGICTHLGCVPTYLPEGHSYASRGPQLFCPCHGGVFDLAGRIFNGTPPPKNLVIPDHEYLSKNIVRIYFSSLTEAWNG